MRKTILSYIAFLGLLVIAIQACKKEPTAIPPSVSEFIGTSPGSFFVQSTGSTFKIPVGVSALSGADRTINYTVSSPTGAAAGVQYSLSKGSVTIPAGKAIDSITVNGIFAGFPGTRRDTLVFTLTPGQEVTPSTFANTYRLVMQKYCNVSLPAFAGSYNKAFDIDESDPTNPYGPYPLDITSGTVSGTTGFILIDNLWDAGGAPVRVNLDWTTPGSFRTTIPDQAFFTHPTYGPARVRGVGNGTFSSCDGTLTVRYEVYVSAGSYGVTTTTIAR